MPVARPAATDVLDKATIKDLGRRQTTAKKYKPREQPKIRNAWKRFSGTPARRAVEAQLDNVFDSKCAYCEIIVPKDIEHFYPKSEFPRKMFEWGNFLRACKNCNNAKNDEFPIVGGAPVLLDPCNDEPSSFFVWDLHTGMPVVQPAGTHASRANKTVDTFDLKNQQLCEERRTRARTFLFLLLQSIETKPTPPDARDWLLDELSPKRPWRSVLRQIVRDPTQSSLLTLVKQAVPAAAPLIAALAA